MISVRFGADWCLYQLMLSYVKVLGTFIALYADVKLY